MSSNDTRSQIAFATSNVVYTCKVVNGSSSEFRSLCTFSDAVGTGDICAVASRDSDILVFTESGRIYEVSFSQQYTGFSEAGMT